MSFQSLPGETWSQILAHLPRFHDLFSASLVSKDFQLLALPHLYRKVYVDRPAYLEQLALRVAVDETSALSVRQHVRGLFVGRWVVQDNTGRESKKVMESLKSVLSVFPRLRHLSLEVILPPQDPEIWEILRVKCTELRSFDLFMLVGQPFFHDARNARILDFQNLTHLAVSTGHIGKPSSFPPARLPYRVFADFYFRVDTLGPLLLPLRNSPNLQSLELAFDQYPRELNWSPNELFSALDDITFPRLCTLRMFGNIDPRFYSSFNDYRSNSLGRFFLRHSHLRTLSLGCNSLAANRAIDPQVVEVLFPSLTRLEAPYFVCASFMASTLANQLENLEITDSSLTPNAPFTIKTLPKLRRLYIRGTGSDSTDWSAIGGLLSCVPGLEEFVCGWQLNMPDPVLPALSIIPELRILGLTAKPLDQSARAAWRERVPVFAEKCPKLRRMNRLLLWETSWDILREEDGKVTVTEYAL